MAEQFSDLTPGEAPVQGFLHRAKEKSTGLLVLTHGAGGNCNSPLLILLAEGFARAGLTTLRCDLPFRQRRRTGPPSPADAKHDQEGLRRAVALMRDRFAGRKFLGGVSYGGRQSSMLAASDNSFLEGLLLLSYPLHPPGRPSQLRTAHLPDLRVPAFFVSGTRDAFGSIDELQTAIREIPAPTKLFAIEGAGHGLLQKSNQEDLPSRIVREFLAFYGSD